MQLLPDDIPENKITRIPKQRLPPSNTIIFHYKGCVKTRAFARQTDLNPKYSERLNLRVHPTMRSERLRSQYPFAKPRKLPEHPFHAGTTPASNSHLHHITAMPNFANHPPTSLPNPIQSRPRVSKTPNPNPQIPKPPGPQRLPHLQLQRSAPFSNPKDETHAQPPNSLSLSHSLTHSNPRSTRNAHPGELPAPHHEILKQTILSSPHINHLPAVQIPTAFLPTASHATHTILNMSNHYPPHMNPHPHLSSLAPAILA
ncbi:hypothetical protein KC19_2G218700, partial [Ceratodon purpureus]